MDEYKEVKNFIEKCKRESKIVILTHGVFDLLHVGHLETLQESLNLGDVLVVGVDSDEFVRTVKGSSRPVITMGDRKKMLESLKIVDFVFEICPSMSERVNLSSYFKKVYQFLDPNVITSGNPSEYHLNQEKNLFFSWYYLQTCWGKN